MLIVSLTSYIKRIETVHLVIESILANSHLPDLIFLSLPSAEFPERDVNLPKKLRSLVYSSILRVNWVDDDNKSYDKLIPTLKNFGFEHDIITIDDDIIYPNFFIQNFIENKSDNCILCYRAREIILFDNKIIPYNQTKKLFFSTHTKPSYSYLFTGVGGVFYPANSLNSSIFNFNLIKKYFSHQDDIWFWVHAISNGNKVNLVHFDSIDRDVTLKDFKCKFKEIESTQKNTLWAINNNGNNDASLARCLKEFINIRPLLDIHFDCSKYWHCGLLTTE